MDKINILIVEDEPLVAQDIAGHLMSVGFGIAGIAHDGEQALQILKTEKTDAALLDITLGSAPDGIEIANIINKLYQIPFVFLTSHADRGTLERVKNTRPAGYLLKPFDENDLLTSLEIAISNYVSSADRALSLDTVNKSVPNPFTEREFEILALLKEGKTNKEIAEKVFLSVNTIKTHLLRIYDKLDAKNRTEALFKINALVGR